MFGLAAAREVAALLRAAAQREILPRFRRLAAGEVRAKSGPLDLVTEADEAAERFITAGLLARHPRALIVGEEAAAADSSLLSQMAAADLAFVVDPVDGTANFAAGVPLFGVMAAAVVNGETIAAWIHDPLGDDTLIALRGEGAWIEGADGHRGDCRVAPPVPLGRMIGAVSWGYMPPEQKALLLPRLARLAATVNFRCAAHEYRLAATGGAHLLVYNRLMPWDHAAGALIHAEAGGASAQFDGQPYSPLRHAGGLVCAPDRTGVEEALEGLIRAARA
ncbi:MAG: inositol monophosphatase [Rubritepida sp.]|jgi:fructose-1,6-bisphosphatase/inositol monophosphatase family enzyme|nr:inositol monophosphatase [Rubritepida sp.]MCU0946387.1 inositol monophosphatase [Rubritepida sp.]